LVNGSTIPLPNSPNILLQQRLGPNLHNHSVRGDGAYLQPQNFCQTQSPQFPSIDHFEAAPQPQHHPLRVTPFYFLGRFEAEIENSKFCYKNFGHFDNFGTLFFLDEYGPERV
jgi:hypothetical protein